MQRIVSVNAAIIVAALCYRGLAFAAAASPPPLPKPVLPASTASPATCRLLFEREDDIVTGGERLYVRNGAGNGGDTSFSGRRLITRSLGYSFDEGSDLAKAWVLGPDCQTVFFLERNRLSQTRLFAARTDGTRKVRLSPAAIEDVQSFAISPRSGRVYFSYGDRFLASVSPDGSNFRAVPRPAEGDLWNFLLSPSGGKAVYQTIERPGRLMAIDLTTGETTVLDDGDGDPAGCRNYDFRFLPGGDRLLFQCEHSEDDAEPGDLAASGFHNLYTVRPDGTERANLYPEAEAAITRLVPTDDGTWVIYQLGEADGLFAASANGKHVIRLDSDEDPARAFRLRGARCLLLQTSGRMTVSRVDGHAKVTVRPASADPEGYLDIRSFDWLDGGREGALVLYVHELHPSEPDEPQRRVAELVAQSVDGRIHRQLVAPQATLTDAWSLGNRVVYALGDKTGEQTLISVRSDGSGRLGLGKARLPSEIEVSANQRILLWKQITASGGIAAWFALPEAGAVESLASGRIRVADPSALRMALGDIIYRESDRF